jgi:hypothetical protein
MGRDDRAGTRPRDAGQVPFGVRLVRNAAHFQWCGARLQTGLVSENESPAICSAKACRAFATWAVVWNNPRLHTPDREKVWVACGEHKQPLADYLAVRSFLKRVEPLGPAGLVKGSSAPSPPANGDAN